MDVRQPIHSDHVRTLDTEGLRRHFGSGAIFVMIVPYCMIHYGKPMTETLGAIGAGAGIGFVDSNSSLGSTQSRAWSALPTM